MRRGSGGGRQVTVGGGGAAHLLCRTDPECRAPLRSSPLRRSCQRPGRDTSSVTSTPTSPTSPTRPRTHRGDVFRGKLVCGVRDEQAGFTHSTVPHDNTLDGLHGCVSLFPAHPRSEDQKQSQDKKGPKSKGVESPRWPAHSSIVETSHTPDSQTPRSLRLEV